MKNSHGGDIYRHRNCIDFSANINPLGTPDEIMDAMKKSLMSVENYPDTECEKLRADLADFHRINPEYIVCGNGASDLIYRFVLAVRPERAVVTAPCFSEYEQALSLVGADIMYYHIEHDNFCIGMDFFEYLTENTDVVFLCNPNNPTGRSIPGKLLKDIACICEKKKIYLFIDECFLDFLSDEGERTLIPSTDKNPYIFVLRAFTKMYAIPGVRLGYGICGDRKLIDKMAVAGQPWNVSIIAQEAGRAAVKLTNFVKDTRKYIENEREFLYQNFDGMKIRYWRGSANYVLLQSDIPLGEKLLEHDILIRKCGNYRGLDDGYYRIAVKDRHSNEMLIEAMRKIL